MQSKATTVPAYLAELPPDRKPAIEAVRATILKNLDKGFEEGMQYGMIGYYVPHSVYPAGYHCDPKQPLPFAALASQKNHMSLYIMGLYAPSPLQLWFHQAWEKTGKKLDMGKCCIRFKKLDDLPLPLIGELFKRVTAQKYIQITEASLAALGKSKPAASSKPAAKTPAKKPTKSAAKKTGAAPRARKSKAAPSSRNKR